MSQRECVVRICRHDMTAARTGRDIVRMLRESHLDLEKPFTSYYDAREMCHVYVGSKKPVQKMKRHPLRPITRAIRRK